LVKVTFRPWEEVVIHESIQYSLDNLVTMRSLGVPPGGLGGRLLWAEGVAFSHAAMPPTEDIIKEMLKGYVHWNSVEWALMPEFKTFIEIPQTKVRIPVLNVSTNETLSDVANALKRTAQQI
jgi:hypothetical protein